MHVVKFDKRRNQAEVRIGWDEVDWIWHTLTRRDPNDVALVKWRQLWDRMYDTHKENERETDAS